MKWEKVNLGDCCTKIGSGSTPKGGSTVYIDEGVALIRSQNVYNLSFDYSGLVFINSEAAEKLNGVKIEPNDILLNITGDSVARTCLVPIEVIPARVNQHVSIIRPRKNVLDATFLSYYLASPFMQSFMLGLAVGKGTSRNAMTKDMISNFEIPCPAMAIQKKIASILKSYDDLIENNQKQIKLLEEAAQRLYKEWFVDLRFPGHEGVKVVDGVPEGWKKEKLIELAELKAGGDKPKIFSKIKSNICKVPIFSNGLENEGLFGYTDKADIGQESITISARGNVGYTCLRREPYLAIVRLICVIPRKMHISTYLYFYLKHTNYNSNGSAQQQLTIPMIKNTVVCVPDENMLSDFDDKARCYFDLVDALKSKISSLREARDRLLPKLMSGEIEV